MKKIFFLLACVLGLGYQSFTQELYYLIEDFEDPELISRWTQSPIIPGIEWEYVDGGLNGVPLFAHQGSVNAAIWHMTTGRDSVKLISPTLELEGAGKPTLEFYRFQLNGVTGLDYLRLYFRNGPTSDWDFIRQWNSTSTDFVHEIFNIASYGEKYLTDTFQIAFEGVVGKDYGVCLDEITVREDTAVPMYVKKTTYNSVDHDAIPGGATNIPVEEVVIRVLGNTGEAILDTLVVEATGSGIGNLDPLGYKLFYTLEGLYTPYLADTSTQIATGSVVGNKVYFTNINQNLILGDNHFWVTASVLDTAKGTSNVRFKIPAQGINVNDTLFPTVDKTLAENHTIKESRFYDDFEGGASGWTLEGDFEVGYPEGTFIIDQSNPSTPFNGDNILATDLDSSYQPNITPATAYYAYSPELDLTYYINAGVYMHKYSTFFGQDSAIIDISVDGGSTWENIWVSSYEGNDANWTEYYNTTIATMAKYKPQFQLRFGIGESTSQPRPGFGIDNFAIIAERLYTDIGVTQVLQPFDDCLGCGNDTVKAWFRNFADGNSPTNIPVYFAYNIGEADSVIVRDTIVGPILKDDSVLFVFDQLANFPQGDYYDDFVVGVDLAGDQDPTNDEFNQQIIIQNSIIPPHKEDFEYEGGIWLPTEGTTWTNKDMSGTITTDPLSPNIWVLSPFGNYANNENSNVESGCYDLTNNNRHVIDFKYWSDCEAGKDGARVEYTINDGDTWTIVEDAVYGAAWGWPTSMVDALGTEGWSGTNDWTYVKAMVPIAAETESKVKFRVVFMSDATNASPQGFAFNDFQVYPAPDDIGVESILSPVNACTGTNDTTVSVRIRNYGFNTIKANDTIIVGIDIDSDPPIIDTVLLEADLLPGATVDITLTSAIDIVSTGSFNISAYTLIEDDPWFFGANNDTASAVYNIWEGPQERDWPDTIQSYTPDLLTLRPYDVTPGGYAFEWYDMTTNDYHGVSQSEVFYSVKITEPTNSCFLYDSIYVELLFNDAGLDSITWPVSTCELSSTDSVQVRIKNFGTDTIRVGTGKIAVSYQVNGGSVYTDSVSLSEDFLPDRTMLHTFSQPYNFSVETTYNIKAWAYYGGDTVRTNDTVYDAITVYGYSPLDLGPDITVGALSTTLDAGPGFVSYVWSTGDSTRTTDISYPGAPSYYVDAEDANGCPATDTIVVWFKVRDVIADALISPATSCEDDLPGIGYIDFRIVNNGTDTITISDTIVYTYSLDSGVVVVDTASPSTNINPGAQYTHRFATSEDFTTVKTYTLDITASAIGDLRLDNDSLSASFATNANPVVDLSGYPSIVFESELELDAGGGGDYSYLWQDGITTSRYFTARESSTYSVVVTDNPTGCAGSDSKLIEFDVLDYALSSFSGISSGICQYENTTLKVKITNEGNKNRNDVNITVGYKISREDVVTESFTIAGEWLPNGTEEKEVTFSNPVSFDNDGNNQIKVFVLTAGDIKQSNDTAQQSVSVDESPAVNFGGDTIQVSIPHQLDAGEHAFYQWQDNYDGRYYDVTSPTGGLYTVTVTDIGNSCITTKSVFVEPASGVAPNITDKLDLRLYPNPASEFLNIEAETTNGEELYIEIYSVSNRLVWTDYHDGFGAYKHKLDISQFGDGVYLLRFKNSQMNHVQQIIIK